MSFRRILTVARTWDLASLSSVQSDGAGAARRTFRIGAHGTNVNFEFLHSAAERVAVHTHLAGGFALVAVVLFEDGHDETLLEFAHGLGIKNIASVHLKD